MNETRRRRQAPDHSVLFSGTFAQLEAEMAQQRTKEGLASRMFEEGYLDGRPPLGFETDDGHLVTADDYDQVVATIDMVRQGNLSKRAATKEIDTSLTTISRALNPGNLNGV